MWAVMAGFFHKNMMYVLMAGAALLAGLGIVFGLRSSGRNAERVDNMRRQIERVERANETRRQVADAHRDGVVPGRVSKFYID